MKLQKRRRKPTPVNPRGPLDVHGPEAAWPQVQLSSASEMTQRRGGHVPRGARVINTFQKQLGEGRWAGRSLLWNRLE